LLLGLIGSFAQHYLHHIDVSFSVHHPMRDADGQNFTLVMIISVVIATVITLPIKAASGRHSGSYVFT
jgi:hypothetical protein